MSNKTNILNEIKLYPNNTINNDTEQRKYIGLEAWINKGARILKYVSWMLMIFCIYFNKLRMHLKDVFYPNENADKTWKLFLGSFLRFSVLCLVLSGLAPLIINSYVSDWKPVALTVILCLAIFYFLRWFTYDLKFDELPPQRWLRFLSYPFKFINIIYLAIWLIPLVLIKTYGYDGYWTKANLTTMFPNSIGASIWLIFLLYLSSVYAEVQYLGFSKGLLVLNYVFQKNAKIIVLLLISLVVMVIIFSVLIMNIEAFNLDPNNEQHGNGRFTQGGVAGWFNAFYMVFITFTTIGFGDLTPATEVGKVVIMISAIFGVAFYSLFTSIIVNGFIQYLDDLKAKERARKEKIYNEGINELNLELQENKISKSIYDLKVRKLAEDIKNSRSGSKKPKLRDIHKKNLKL